MYTNYGGKTSMKPNTQMNDEKLTLRKMMKDKLWRWKIYGYGSESILNVYEILEPATGVNS